MDPPVLQISAFNCGELGFADPVGLHQIQRRMPLKQPSNLQGFPFIPKKNNPFFLSYGLFPIIIWISESQITQFRSQRYLT